MDESTEEILERTRRRQAMLDTYKSELGLEMKENEVPAKGGKRKSGECINPSGESDTMIKRPSFNEADKDKSGSQLYPLAELESMKKFVDGAVEEAEKQVEPSSITASEDSCASESDRPSTRPSARKARFAALSAHLDEFEDEIKSVSSTSSRTPQKKRPTFGRERASESASVSDSGSSVSAWSGSQQRLAAEEPKGVTFNDDVMSKTISTIADTTVETLPDVFDEPQVKSGIESFYREKKPATPTVQPSTPSAVAAKANMWEKREAEAQKEKRGFTPQAQRTAPSQPWKSNLKSVDPPKTPSKTPTKNPEPVRYVPREPEPERRAPIKWPIAGGSVAARAAMFETNSPPRKPTGIGLSKKEPFPAGPFRAPAPLNSPKPEKEETEEERKNKLHNLRNRWEVSSMSGTPLHPDAKNDDLVNAAVQLAKSTQGAQRQYERNYSKSNISTTPTRHSDRNKEAQKEEDAVITGDEEEESDYEENEESDPDEMPNETPSPVGETTEEEGLSDESGLDPDLEAALESALSTHDANTDSEETQPKDEEPAHIPLIHSVSFYRNMEKGRKHPLGPTGSTPVVVRTPGASRERRDVVSESEAARNASQQPSFDRRIERLVEKEKVQKQQILQASRALSLCRTQEEFRGSREEVDAQRALLLATEGRRASLTEMERLAELRREREREPSLGSMGTLTIKNISIPLKREFINHNFNRTGDLLYYFVGLFKFQDTIHSTQMINSDEALRDGKLAFPNYINLTNLPPGFLVRFEVYALRTKREQIPHDEKYRLKSGTMKSRGKSSSMIAQGISSPGGPSAILDPSFQQIASLDISLASVKKKQFFLAGVKGLQITSPLEESIVMHLRCTSEEYNSVIEEKGFLSAFEEIEGLGSWTRMWCVLKDGRMSFWRYPDDEYIKEPLNVVDLSTCINESVGPTSRELCARPHTLFVDVVCDDRGTKSTFRIMLSGDSKEECSRWCKCVNETLRNLRMWNPPKSRK